MITLTGPGAVYTGQEFTLTAQGNPGGQIQLMEQRFPADVVISVKTADSSGRADFYLQVAQAGVVNFYAQQSCTFIFCDKSSPITVSANPHGTTGDGTTIPTPTPESPLVLAVEKAVVTADEAVKFTLTGPPGMQVDLMWKTLIDQRIATVYLDGVTGRGTSTYIPPNQGMKTFYAQQAGALCTAALGYLGCKISNDVTVTVTSGPCEPGDIGCILTGGGTGGALGDFTAWAADVGKWVILALVVLLFLYIGLVYILPEVTGKAAGAAARGAVRGGAASG